MAEKYGDCEETVKEAEKEAKVLLERFSQLKNEMLENKSLGLLTGNTEDIKIYNEVYNEWCKKLGTNPTFFSVPWLYAECYMYRKMEEIFANSKHFKGFDPFREQKFRAFLHSFPGPILLG